jgi:hemerythrin superfamily protein
MPGNHDKTKTPTEKRPAPKGSLVGRFSGYHTAASKADEEVLVNRWKRKPAEVRREALRLARESGAEYGKMFTKEKP